MVGRDIVMFQNDALKAYERYLAAWEGENQQARPVLEAINDPEPEKLDEKSGKYTLLQARAISLHANALPVLFLRNQLQTGLLAHDQDPPAVINLAELSKFMKMLEDVPELEAIVIMSTKIHKVFIAICKLDPIPGDEEFKFREKSEALIAKWRKTIYDSRTAQKWRDIQMPQCFPVWFLVLSY
jgi:hypothetical protein